MNVASVRRMTKLPHRDNLLNLPPQRITLRCAFCKWSMKNVLITESSRIHAGHMDRRHA